MGGWDNSSRLVCNPARMGINRKEPSHCPILPPGVWADRRLRNGLSSCRVDAWGAAVRRPNTRPPAAGSVRPVLVEIHVELGRLSTSDGSGRKDGEKGAGSVSEKRVLMPRCGTREDESGARQQYTRGADLAAEPGRPFLVPPARKRVRPGTSPRTRDCGPRAGGEHV